MITAVIILLATASIVIVCIYSLIKRFGGKSTCCGTEIIRTPIKKLKNIQGSFTVEIEGMHCENCKRSVMEAINAIEGASAKVNLEKKIAVVSYNQKVEKETVAQAIESAGFTVTKI